MSICHTYDFRPVQIIPTGHRCGEDAIHLCEHESCREYFCRECVSSPEAHVWMCGPSHELVLRDYALSLARLSSRRAVDVLRSLASQIEGAK